MTHLGYY